VVNLNGLSSATTPARFSRDDFSVVPEFGLNLNYQISQNMRAYIGYTLIYWFNTTRPGDVSGASNPRVTLPSQPDSSDFWAQGLNAGFEFRF
jgi:hypothetical protein